jgi:hypothetical protein
MPNIIAITDLGSGNKGQIAASDLTSEQRNQLVADISNAKYIRKTTRKFRCVDGRTPEDGLKAPDGMADPQEAGGAAISEAAADLMTSHPESVSQLVTENVKANIDNGFSVVVHGDDKHGKEGCGANKHLRAILRSNAENTEVVTDIAWTLCQALGLEAHVSKDDIRNLIATGKQNADTEALWDATPEEITDLAIKHGAMYEELIEDHMERAIVVDIGEEAFDEEQFMKDHIRPDGKPIEVFVASLGAIKAKLFEIARSVGQSEKTAARKMMGVVLFNIGVPKELTAENTSSDPDAALPVIVLG